MSFKSNFSDRAFGIVFDLLYFLQQNQADRREIIINNINILQSLVNWLSKGIKNKRTISRVTPHVWNDSL